MIYDYVCNACGNKYERSNSIEHRNKSGKCPSCESDDTKRVMSTPLFKPCGGGHSKTVK